MTITGKADVNASKDKANELREIAQGLGWKSKVSVASDETVECRCVRDQEVVIVQWHNGRCLATATYTYGARTVKIKNASAARQIMVLSPEEAAARQPSVVTRHVKSRAVDGDETPHRRKLPFDLEKSTDAEIIAAVVNKRISWRNRISGLVESALVLPKGITVSIINTQDALTFCSDDGGMRSVYLSKILSVE